MSSRAAEKEKYGQDWRRRSGSFENKMVKLPKLGLGKRAKKTFTMKCGKGPESRLGLACKVI